MDILSGISLTGITLADRRKTKKADPVVAKRGGSGESSSLPVFPADKPRRSPKLQFVVENWTPLDRLTYIGQQHCPSCGQTTRYIAGDLIRYSQDDKVAGERTIRTRAFSAADTRFAHLPRRFETLDAETCTCPCCLSTSETLDAILLSTREIQLPLFV